MKKYFLIIFFFSFVFLSGCNKNNNIIEQKEEQIIQSGIIVTNISGIEELGESLSIESGVNVAIETGKVSLEKKTSIHVIFYGGDKIPGENVEYDVPGVVIEDLPYGQFNQKSFFAKYEDESTAELQIGHGNMEGSFLYYTFPKVGIKVYFEDDFADYFMPEFTGKSKLLKYKNNKISYVGDNNYPKDNQFVYVFQKDPNQSLVETIRKDHSVFFQKGCIIQPMQNFQRRHNKELINYNDIEVYQMRRAEGNNQCLINDLGLGLLYFVMSKDHPNTYYMISKIDGCGPSCETFTSIELLP